MKKRLKNLKLVRKFLCYMWMNNIAKRKLGPFIIKSSFQQLKTVSNIIALLEILTPWLWFLINRIGFDTWYYYMILLSLSESDWTAGKWKGIGFKESADLGLHCLFYCLTLNTLKPMDSYFSFCRILIRLVLSFVCCECQTRLIYLEVLYEHWSAEAPGGYC